MMIRGITDPIRPIRIPSTTKGALTKKSVAPIYFMMLISSFLSAGIIIVLLLVSIFLISNTVTMGISVRKDEINIMKYIGATDFFVRAPFVVEGILIGLIGSVIPLIIIYFVYTHVITYVVSRFTMLSSLLNFLPVETVFNSLIPISLLIGIGIGFFGSFITVRKHLHV